MVKVEFENDNKLYIGNCEEIEKMWVKLSATHFNDWTFSLSNRIYEENKIYAIYIDLLNPPQMQLMNSSHLKDFLEKEVKKWCRVF